MARTFTLANSEYLLGGSSPVSGVPLSIACWFQTTDVMAGITQGIVSVGANGTNDRFDLRILIGGDLLASSTSPSTSDDASVTGVTANTWHHGVAVFSASNSRVVYRDGSGNTGSSTSSVTVATPDRVSIGAQYANGAALRYLDGMVAEVGIWNIALGTADVDALANGASPLMVRPSGLVFYAPLIRGVSASGGNDIDVRGGINLVDTNTVTVGNHPRIYRAGGGISRRLGAAAAPAAAPKRLLLMGVG